MNCLFFLLFALGFGVISKKIIVKTYAEKFTYNVFFKVLHVFQSYIQASNPLWINIFV